jgi:dolichyl-phosphate beta-glucosyltransferase
MKPYISLIIPAYNEETRIERSLNSALDYFNSNSISAEIIVVNDGSKDNTPAVVESFGHGVKLLNQPRNMGKGAAVRTGMLAAVGDYRIFSDADFSTPIYEIEKVVALLKQDFDVCIGSRAEDPSMIKVHQPFYREFMGKAFNKFVQLLLVKGIKDTQCGFKGFRATAADVLFNHAKINGFSFDVEILFLAKKLGLRVTQTPVEWYNDLRSTVNPITDSFNMIIELFKIRFLHKNLSFSKKNETGETKL